MAGTAAKGIGWDKPASETVDGAPEELQLWAWCDQELEGGATQQSIADQIGCATASMKHAIRTRKERAATAPTPSVPLPERKGEGRKTADGDGTAHKRDACATDGTAPAEGGDEQEPHRHRATGQIGLHPGEIAGGASTALAEGRTYPVPLKRIGELIDAPQEALVAFIGRYGLTISAEEFVAGWAAAREA